MVTALEVNTGDVIRTHTGNGAGHGGPRERPRRRIVEDLADGLLTAERARSVYGYDE